jgi:hypothetical protein
VIQHFLAYKAKTDFDISPFFPAGKLYVHMYSWTLASYGIYLMHSLLLDLHMGYLPRTRQL